MADRAAYPPPYLTLAFGDGDYLFKLGLAQIAELQTKCGAGIGAVVARVLRGRYQLSETHAGPSVGIPTEAEWYVADLVETVRLALIGGGEGIVDGQAVKVDAVRARQLVDTYVVGQPLAEAWTLAASILAALVVGYDAAANDDDPDKKKAQATDGSTTRGP